VGIHHGAGIHHGVSRTGSQAQRFSRQCVPTRVQALLRLGAGWQPWQAELSGHHACDGVGRQAGQGAEYLQRASTESDLSVCAPQAAAKGSATLAARIAPPPRRDRAAGHGERGAHPMCGHARRAREEELMQGCPGAEAPEALA